MLVVMAYAVRLFILGALARRGPMHGHEMRRAAQIDRTDMWTELNPGSIYGAITRMSHDGVIEALRSEQDGNRPVRTIYGITEAGQQELKVQRDKLLADTRLRPDPVDLALQYTADLPAGRLRELIERRRAAFASELDEWRELERTAAPYLEGLEKLTFAHRLARLETEVSWHDDLLAALAEDDEPAPDTQRGN